MASASLVFGSRRVCQLVVAFVAAALATSTASAVIVHQYTFNDGTASDSAGTADGTLEGSTGVINTLGRLDLTGNMDGDNSDLATDGSYVDLPNNLLEPLGGHFSIETWFSIPQNATYSFLWSFGISGSFIEGEAAGGDGEYIGMIAPHGNITSRGVPNAGIDGGPIEIQLDFPGTAGITEYPPFPANEEQQFIVTFDVDDHSVPVESPATAESGGTMKLYWNGEYVGSQYIVPYIDLTNFEDVNSWIGRANWNDPLFDGTVNEFTIFDSVLTAAEAADRYDFGYIPVFQGAPGDVNGNGVADLPDWDIIKMNMFTDQLTPQAGDLDSSGYVDTGDFRIWKTAYLDAGGSAAIFGEAVPEPSALVLIGAAVACLAFRRRRALIAVSMPVLALAVATGNVIADTTWVGPVGGDYADDDNWLSTDGFPGVPDVTFDDWALIESGTINLSTDMAPIVGPEIRIEGTDPVVFNILPGGALTLDGNFSFFVNDNPGSALNMTGGSLTAHSLWMFGSNPRSLNLSGNASISAIWPDGGGIYFPPTLRVEGPDVSVEAFNMYGYVSFYEVDNYTAVITGPEHSTIKSSRDAYVSGNLVLEFDGYTPTLGETWDLVYAANELAADGRKFDSIDASSAGSLPDGVGFYQSIVPGPGGVGEILRLALIRQLSLTVNRATGAVTVDNPGNGATDLNGYTIGASDGAIDVAAWNSFDDQNLGTFVQGATPTNMEILETATTGYNVAATTSISLGDIYDPQPTLIGQDTENMTFTYTTPSGLVVDAAVNYEGRGRNNLVVTVDPTTGQAIVDNESDFTVQIDGYTLTSADGSLMGSGWSSLEDQGMAGWDESNATATRLAEFNVNTAMTISPDETFNLGQVFNTGAGMEQDLEFQFLLSDRKKFIKGIVLFDTLAALDGDFNGDGKVDAGDYVTWRDTLGDTPNYNLWKANFGDTSGNGASANTAAVPEPSSALLLAASFGIVGLSLSRRRNLTPSRR